MATKRTPPKKAAYKKTAAPIKKIVTQVRKVYLTEQRMKNGWSKVRSELRQLGLLGLESRLAGLQCTYDGPVSAGTLWNGYCHRYLAYYSYQDNMIHVPAFVRQEASLKLDEKRCLSDVLRHECGHALEDKYGDTGLFRDKKFIRAFGDIYGENVLPNANPDNFVTTYAMTNIQEDFAETFMFFMKCKGVLPEKWSAIPAICAKWKLIAEICQKLAKTI